VENKFPILIADDNLVARKLLEKTLAKEGHEIVSVENGKKALEMFNERFFPIVLTDWMMPEMDGPTLCQAIREKITSSYVYIILLTAKADKEDIISGIKSGADDYLTKPIDNAELIARLKNADRILTLEKSLKDANSAIKKLSITDNLTKCYNRGYLTRKLPEEIAREKRYGDSLSLIFCDIDHFKKINDTYGHQTGDEVLVEFANCLNKTIRTNIDWIGRYGGEEFILVLPETPLDGAARLAERLRKNIAAHKITTDGNDVSITSSFGVTGFNSKTLDTKISAEKIIGAADKYLYQAKETGRNKVISGPL
jgi:two-component system cell cycle response regulator